MTPADPLQRSLIPSCKLQLYFDLKFGSNKSQLKS